MIFFTNKSYYFISEKTNEISTTPENIADHVVSTESSNLDENVDKDSTEDNLNMETQMAGAEDSQGNEIVSGESVDASSSAVQVRDNEQTVRIDNELESSVLKPADTSEVAQDNIEGNVSVSSVVINLNKVLEESSADSNEPKEKDTSASDSHGTKDSTPGNSILAKYINETRQRHMITTGSLQLQRNIHLLERNNVQITEKQGHMLNSSVSIYPSKPKSVDSANVSGPDSGIGLVRMQSIVQPMTSVPSQGYRLAVPMQHFVQYPGRMVAPYSMPQHSPGHMRPGHIQLQERSQPPPLIPFQNQMGEHLRLQGYGHLQIQRHPAAQLSPQGQSSFQERMMQMNMQTRMPRMPMQMQYPTYYAGQNRFPISTSPSGIRERPLSDPNSMNVSGMHAYRMSNIHAENFERYPRSYSEPHEEPTRMNPDIYQQEMYHDNSYRSEAYQRDPNVNASEMFYRTLPAASDRPMEMYQSKSNHGDTMRHHTPDGQSVLQKELEGSGRVMNTSDNDKVITKQEFIETIDEAHDETLEDNEFVDFEEAFSSEQRERQTQEGENFEDNNISIEHFLQVDYSDNANNQSSHNEEDQQQQQRAQPLYQMNRQKTIIFKCKYCKKKFFHKRELEKHMITHSTYTRVRSDGKKRDFPCTLCDCSYIRKTHLERHMLSHMRKQDQYKCGKCNFFFVHRRHLEIHNLQTHSGRSEDDEINARFDEQIQIVSVDPNAPDFGNDSQIAIAKIKEEMIDIPQRKPLHKHSNVKRSFFCQHCGRAFLKNQYLRAHIRNFHDGNFSENTASELVADTSTPVLQPKNLFCPICGQGFIKMKYFRSHWNKFHEHDHETRIEVGKKTNPVPLSAPPPPLVKKPFVCHICNNGFYHPQNLKRHIRDVHYKKKLEAKDNQASNSSDSGITVDPALQVQVSVENIAPKAPVPKRRPPSKANGAFCPVCCKEFLYEYNVRRHIRNAHPQYAHMAPVKTKPTRSLIQDEQQQDEQEQEQDQSITLSSLSSSNINESQLMGWNIEDDGTQGPSTSHSAEERPFKCTLCDKRFFRLLFLKRHFGTSHGVLHPDTTEDDWSFECKACGKRFARNDSLIRHMKFKHKKLFRAMRAEKIRQNYETANKAQQEENKVEESQGLTGPKIVSDKQETAGEEGTETTQTETDPFKDIPNEAPAAPTPKIKIYRCSTCNESFRSSLEYIKHQRTVHARQRKHKCKVCNFKFMQYSHMRRHMNQVHSKQHSGGTKKCTKCEFTASNNIALSNHMRAHTREEASKRYRYPEPEPEDIDSQPEEDIEYQDIEEIETQQEEEEEAIDQQQEEMESLQEEGVVSEQEERIEMHQEIESQGEEEIESQPDDELESQPEEEMESENSPENANDSMAETFNESLAKTLDETLAETMAQVEENIDENLDD